MTRLFWRLVHLLPWRLTRHVCDLCDEFPDDPRVIAKALDWLDEPAVVPIGWRCAHVDITGSSSTGGIFPTRPNVWCGCTMQPIYQAGNH